jgi:hypothetical protein
MGSVHEYLILVLCMKRAGKRSPFLTWGCGPDSPRLGGLFSGEPRRSRRHPHSLRCSPGLGLCWDAAEWHQAVQLAARNLPASHLSEGAPEHTITRAGLTVRPEHRDEPPVQSAFSMRGFPPNAQLDCTFGG